MNFANLQFKQLARLFPLILLLSSLSLFAAKNAQATDYYVATTGSNSNPGTIDKPFATLQKGHDAAMPGDTVYVRGGTYSIVAPATSGAGILISKSGTSDTSRIKFWAYLDEVPIFDFSQMTISTTGYTNGLQVTGSWLHFKGLEVCNVPMNTRSNNGMGVDGASNDIFERLNLHHNSGSGMFIGHGTGGHLVLNCDSHDNYDPTSSQGAGQNADGFGCHYQETGSPTVFRGCRAWWNSDDGYDLISQEVPVTFENCWAMSNGYINSGAGTPASGNGNGFKAGSSKTGIRHILRNNVAWKNRASGFYANHSSGGNTWYNNTSYSNGTQYNMLASPPDDSSVVIILMGSLVHIMKNNIGFPNKNTYMDGVDTSFNTWDLNITPSANDFVSVTDTGAMDPRQPDGSLPNLNFMKLRAGSPMIDKGTDVQLPRVGAAPDLGAYEFGTSTDAGDSGPPGTGDASTDATTTTGGTGGTAGSGGAAGSSGIAGSGGRSPADAGPSDGHGGNGGSGANGGAAGTIGAGGAGATAGGLPEGGGPSMPPSTSGGSSGSSGARDRGNGDASTSSGCSCRISATSERAAPGGLIAMLGVLGLALRRRKQFTYARGARRRGTQSCIERRCGERRERDRFIVAER
ncbi:MAG TPA: right-handed parallel beta-helix repeat-containing protein [Polyangiaceae bacterium]|nr:right-handed parallel beta-helix repeat-containing protein [Polyangiaceae bacterium]